MVKKYTPERGDVVWLDFDPTKGSEIQKYRPALVLSTAVFNAATKLALVAPITSTVRGHGFEVHYNGKHTTGVILSQQVRTVDYANRRIKKAETAPAMIVAEVLGRVQAIIS